MKRFLLCLAAGALVLGLAGCGDDEDDAGTQDDAEEVTTTAGDDQRDEDEDEGDAGGIEIKDFEFDLSGVSAIAGGEISITNSDDVTHTFTADNGEFDSGEIDGGSDGSVTVDESGEYGVHCEIHSNMKGTLTVS